MKKTILFHVLLLLCLDVISQKKWTGTANDGLWNNPLNWNEQILPSDADTVVLDNENVATGYYVVLPSTTVVIKYLIITPAAGSLIELNLPVENTLTSAFQISGKGYGVTINAGGVLKNSSGATSGYGLVIADSIRINNGGTYIHNTKRSNANIVKMLSRAQGTEKGAFVFDVPGTAGYTPSVSGRTFGSLVLSAKAAGKARTYTSSASSIVTVRGDLSFTGDVAYNLNFTKDLVIEGDLIQKGGSFNIATKATSNNVKIKGNIKQDAGAIITQSGTGVPSIELCGLNEQHVLMLGEIKNPITMNANNDNGVALDASLMLPYELIITKGVIKANNESLLTLDKNCVIKVTDSLQNYVSGALKKVGLAGEDFVFPVGKNSGQPLKVIDASGDITVKYTQGSTAAIGEEKSSSLKTIASNGYWSLTGSSSGNVILQLRYDNRISATEKKDIVIAAFENDMWVGKSSMPAENGLVVSEPITLTTEPKFISFAAAESLSPLAAKFLRSSLQNEDAHTVIYWSVADNNLLERFEVEGSTDGKLFTKIRDVAYLRNVHDYRCDVSSNPSYQYFRVKAFENNNSITIDKILSAPGGNTDTKLDVYSSFNFVMVKVKTNETENVQLVIYAASGAIVEKQNYSMQKGENTVTINTNKLSSGTYLLTIEGAHFKRQVRAFVKL